MKKIISGGQTGADRGGLDAARHLGLEHGGWCPKGRVAEDGTIPSRYKLKETGRASYPLRTRLNIRDADGTVVFTDGPVLSGGTKLTLDLALAANSPLFVVDLRRKLTEEIAAAFLGWLDRGRVSVLNVAGPRESKCPGTQLRVKRFLVACLKAPPALRAARSKATVVPLPRRPPPVDQTQPVVRAFVTGSVAYGTPHDKSDLDLVVLVDTTATLDLLARWADGVARSDAHSGSTGISAMFGQLNLIATASARDFEVWRRGTQQLRDQAPVTREQACTLFAQLRAQAADEEWGRGRAPDDDNGE